MALKRVTVDNRHFDLSYTLQNPEAARSLLILHGWRSDKRLMQAAFETHLPGFRHIYLDLPGFGSSSNDYILTTDDYAAVTHGFLDALGPRPDAIIGHSFGGKVATLLNPPVLVLLSSAGIPVPKPLNIRAKIWLFKRLKPFGGKALRDLFASKDVVGMPENMYETMKNVVDEDFTEHFKRYQGEALLFWGKEDSATPLWAGETVASLIPSSRFYPLDGDHFFFLKQAPVIAGALTEILEKPL